MGTYRAVIVGCGRIGCLFDDDPKRRGVWTHAGAYRANPRTDLVALVDPDADALAHAMRRWDVEKGYASVEQLLREQRVDVLSICTPVEHHLPVLEAARRGGVRAVWCEKPFADDLDRAERFVAAAGLWPIAVNHGRRWDAPYEAARAWLDSGEAGELLAVSASYSGGISNIGSHLFDALRFLFGDATWVWAFCPHPDAPDPALAGTVQFDSVACQISAIGPPHLLVVEFDVIGTTGRLRITGNGTRVETWRMEPSQRYSGYSEFGEAAVIWNGIDEHRLVKALDDLLDALEQGREPRCSALDGLRAVELTRAFVLSARSGDRVGLPLAPGQRVIPVTVG